MAAESLGLSIDDHCLLPFPPGTARLFQGRMWATRRMNKRRQRVGVRRLQYPFTVKFHAYPSIVNSRNVAGRSAPSLQPKPGFVNSAFTPIRVFPNLMVILHS